MYLPHWKDILKYTPTVSSDSGLLTNQMIPEFVTRKETKPFIIGFNTNEGHFTLNAMSAAFFTFEQLKVLLTFRFGANNVNDILDFYNIDESTVDYEEEWAQILTDQMWKCPQRKIAQNMESEVFFYEFDIIDAEVYGQLLDDKPYCSEHVCHGSEIVTFWRPFEEEDSDSAHNYTYSEQSEAVAQTLYDYWTNFAKSGDPNDALTDWLDYNEGEGRQVWKVSDSDKSVLVDWDAVCDFWDVMGYAGDYCAYDNCFPTTTTSVSTTEETAMVTNVETVTSTTEDGIDGAVGLRNMNVFLVCLYSIFYV